MALIERQRFLLRILINDKLRKKFYSGSDCGLSSSDAELLRSINQVGVERKAVLLKRKMNNQEFLEAE